MILYLSRRKNLKCSNRLRKPSAKRMVSPYHFGLKSYKALLLLLHQCLHSHLLHLLCHTHGLQAFHSKGLHKGRGLYRRLEGPNKVFRSLNPCSGVVCRKRLL